MRDFSKRLPRLLSEALARLQRRFQQSRPGSILIMVVALLVLLALMGTAYIATARLDRSGAVQLQQQGTFKDITDSLVKSVSDQIKQTIAGDVYMLTGTTPSDPTSNNYVADPKGPLWLSTRAPSLLPDLTSATLGYTPLNANGGVAWRTVSRQAQTKLESPLGNNIYPDSTIINYDTQQDLSRWFRATNVTVYYDGTLPETDPALVGHTYVFPAFKRTYFDYPTGKWVDDPQTYIAADATGAGVADSGLVRLTQTPFLGVTFFYGMRVVDNADGLNVNTAWSPDADRDSKGNSYNFFTSDIDFVGNLAQANNSGAPPAEMRVINNLRYAGIDTAMPVVADDAGVRNDVAYLTLADAFHNQLGRRVSYPNKRAGAGDPTNATLPYSRPFVEADTAGFRYRFGMVNQDAGRSHFDDNIFNNQANDSIYHAALNYTTNAANHFKFVASNNASYWFDWNFNNDGFQSPPRLSIGGQLGNSFNGLPFRTPRATLVANNPVKNLARELDANANPAIPAQAFTGPNPMLPADTVNPHKVCLNTAFFGDLYRAFAVAFVDPALVFPGNVGGFQVATDDPANLGTNTGTFRNSLRDPGIGSSKGGNGTVVNNATVKFDSYNMALLRAAIAATNVETLRDNHGTTNGNYFYPDVTRRIVNLQTNNGAVQAAVYGVTPQVYITEVYVDTDQSDHGGNKNANGLVAVRLYNPYPFSLDLKDYQLFLVDRKAGGSYPAMKITPLDPTNANPLPTINAGDTIVLSNYKTGGGGTAAGYLPGYLPKPRAAKWLYWPNIYKVIEDLGTPGSGGELLILKPMTAGGVPEVPVDSFDFTGLLLNQATKKADAWHYARAQTTTGTDAWKFVYPGQYTGTNAKGGVGGELPRQEGVEHVTWDPAKDPDPWEPAGPPGLVSLEVGNAFTITPNVIYANRYPGIQLCNVDFGGFNKPGGGGPRVFPYGGFARTGDVVQATFIGSYLIAPTVTQGVVPKLAIEINAVTMDSMYSDDGDPQDDAEEQLGRFVPIRNAQIDDYNPYGYYGTAIPNPDPTVPPPGTNPQRPFWRYHFATNVLNSFTAVSNPHDDMFPNYSTNSYVGARPPTPVPNITTTGANGTAAPNGPEEAHLPVEGLINLNTASWQVLAGIEWLPPAAGIAKTNADVAKLIVRYRDIDDGINRGGGVPPRGHGPFNNILELNAVFDPGAANATFGNAFGTMPKIPDIKWGNYAPGTVGKTVGTYSENRVENDFMSKTLMVSRVSNLLTTRSDSFTVYIVVQGWKNVGTAFPEMVVQKRAAFLVDRSGVTPTNKNVTSYSIPTK